MDVNELRSAVTFAGLILFLALIGWTWSRKRQAAFDDAAQLPLLGDVEGQAVDDQGNDRSVP